MNDDDKAVVLLATSDGGFPQRGFDENLVLSLDRFGMQRQGVQPNSWR